MGDKIYARALSEMLYRIPRLKSTGLLTKYLNYYSCAQFDERLCKYLGLDTLIVAAKQHEAQYPERSAHSKSLVLEALVCYIYRTVDETAAISFIRNVLVDFAAHDSFFLHRTGDEIPWDKLGNSWGLLWELVAQAAGPTGKVSFDVSEDKTHAKPPSGGSPSRSCKRPCHTARSFCTRPLRKYWQWTY
jgi:hypothetical protein